MKVVFKIIVGIVVVIALAILVRNSIIQKVVRSTVLKTTGFDIEIGKLHAGLIQPRFDLNDARLINPEDFPEATALEIKTLRVGYDWRSLFSDEIHLSEVTVDVPRAILVIREDGESNLARLGKNLEEQKPKDEEPTSEGSEEPPPAEPKKEKAPRKVRVDVLTVKIGKVEMRRYREGESKPEVKIYDVNFDRTATNVSDLQTVNAMITAGVIEAFGKQALQGLDKLLDEKKPEIEKIGEVFQKAADKMAERLRRAAERNDSAPKD